MDSMKRGRRSLGLLEPFSSSLLTRWPTGTQVANRSGNVSDDVDYRQYKSADRTGPVEGIRAPFVDTLASKVNGKRVATRGDEQPNTEEGSIQYYASRDLEGERDSLS